MMAMRSWIVVGVVGAGLLAAAGVASAQENLDAGKSGAQLYQSNCAICHKSAQALDKSGGGLFGLESFLREHYNPAALHALWVGNDAEFTRLAGVDLAAADRLWRDSLR